MFNWYMLDVCEGPTILKSNINTTDLCVFMEIILGDMRHRSSRSIPNILWCQKCFAARQ